MSADTTDRPSVSLDAQSRAPRWLRGIFMANLVAQIGIVVTGGVVRLTGSGLGCPTWPECVEGSYVPTTRRVLAVAVDYVRSQGRRVACSRV